MTLKTLVRTAVQVAALLDIIRRQVAQAQQIKVLQVVHQAVCQTLNQVVAVVVLALWALLTRVVAQEETVQNIRFR